MMKTQCNKLNSSAYNSCMYSYYQAKDKEDIFNYWIYLLKVKRTCEASGVKKALDFIDLIENILKSG